MKKIFKKFNKAFSLAETLITLIVIGVILSISIPILFSNTMQQNNKTLFRSAYNSIEEIIAEFMDDPLIYTYGTFDDSTFCNSFVDKVNTIGSLDCDTSTTPDTPNFITSNGMKWFGLDTGFSSAICDEIAALTGYCMKIQIDVNAAKAPNTTDAGNENRDILSVYLSSTGKMAVPAGLETTFME